MAIRNGKYYNTQKRLSEQATKALNLIVYLNKYP